MLVSLKEIFAYANRKKCAVGAFNCPNLESVMAIIEASEEMDSPVILSCSEAHRDLISIDIIGPIMLMFARRAQIPVCVHLDHGKSLESCVKAIRIGFSSVMIDYSAVPYADNIDVTSQVVRLAHAVGVTVEAELGHIFTSVSRAGQDNANIETAEQFENVKDIYTDPDAAKEFAETTKIDALAIAFGTSHGIYKIKPALDLARINDIKRKIDVPLVMHGGSGLSKDEYQTAIRNGIRKINYYTYMTLAGGQSVRAAINMLSAKEDVFFHDLPLIAMKEMKDNIKKAIAIFSFRDVGNNKEIRV